MVVAPLACTFWAPATPVRLEMPARFTRVAICLQASEMDEMTVASSPSMVPFCSSCAHDPSRPIVRTCARH